MPVGHKCNDFTFKTLVAWWITWTKSCALLPKEGQVVTLVCLSLEILSLLLLNIFPVVENNEMSWIFKANDQDAHKPKPKQR